MNALPLKNPQPLTEVVDDLVANFGLRRVILAVAARLFRKQHPPDIQAQSSQSKRRNVDLLSNHLRQDLGLPPQTHQQVRIDPIMLHRH
ncbi:hypothetical protein [Cognatiyoonia sp. IB215182]|uniref:hypothetical protein n=1 Tax=Cognatiyoonia sp. IB215182 TaxID=3097353 RepID=UPI002A123A47|nr:hypothetical protein [Cognatiyoonia sp. IB215182]MDX8354687.1 hypothetical protein [Cognatiyoonia sp. IB215182]